MRRYQRLTDLFTVTCRQCGSEDVDLSVDSCGLCGNTVEAECNSCGAAFRGHDYVFGDFEEA